MKKSQLLMVLVMLVGVLQSDSAHVQPTEQQPDMLCFNMKLLGFSSLLSYSIMLFHEDSITSAVAPSALVCAVTFCCLFGGAESARTERTYDALSLQDRIRRILYHTGKVLRSSEGTDSIGQMACTYCLLAVFWRRWQDWIRADFCSA